MVPAKARLWIGDEADWSKSPPDLKLRPSSIFQDVPDRRLQIVWVAVAAFPSPDPMMGMSRRPIAPRVLVHQINLSPEQPLALDHKLGPHRLGGNEQNTEERFYFEQST